MNIADWLMITAVLTGPVIAVQLTKYLDRQKEIRERKLWIFKTLMATRAAQLSPLHIEALNKIDLEFDYRNNKDRDIIEAWKEYLDLLNNTTMTPEQWFIKKTDLLVELLHKMAHSLDYEFDKTHIKNSSYYPRGYGEFEDDHLIIRRGLKNLFEGKTSIPINVINTPPNP
jgi:Family of unknown function (DUF6680)